jgi:adenosine deaminase
MPKIELHAHLFGCIRQSTFLEFLSEDQKNTFLEFKNEKSYSKAFGVFSLINKVVCNLEILKRITIEMMEDFEQQNCIYLEIRSTLKNFEEKGKLAYLQVILTQILKKNQEKGMKVRFLLSINRENPYVESNEAFEAYQGLDV